MEGTCHSSPWSAVFVSGSSPSFKCPLCIGSSPSWLLPSFLTTTSKFPPQDSVPSGLCGCSGSSQDIFTSYRTHSLRDYSHSHGSHPRCVNCPPPPSQSTGQTIPLCPMTSFEPLCPEVRPSHSLPNLLLTLHPASVNRSATHHPKIPALPLLVPCPTL